MRIKKQLLVGVVWTWWDDTTIEVDAYRTELGRKRFKIDHVEDQVLDAQELDELEAKVTDMVHMINKRALKRTELLLF